MENELLTLKWNNHKATFFQSLADLRMKEIYTDVTIACENLFYPAHRLVLSTCSDYFKSVFAKTSCTSPVIILKGIDIKELEYLLEYMYLGEVDVQQNDLQNLIKAAECLQIKGLVVPDEDSISPKKRMFPDRSNGSSKRLKTSSTKEIQQPNSHVQNYVNDKNIGSPVIPVETIKLEADDRVIPTEHTFKSEESFYSKESTCDSNNALEEFSRIKFNENLPGSSCPKNETTNKSETFSAEDSHYAMTGEIAKWSTPRDPPISDQFFAETAMVKGAQKEYHCSYCTYSSNVLCNLRRHVMLHTGEKPHACPYCSYRCIQKSSLNAHVLNCRQK